MAMFHQINGYHPSQPNVFICFGSEGQYQVQLNLHVQGFPSAQQGQGNYGHAMIPAHKHGQAPYPNPVPHYGQSQMYDHYNYQHQHPNDGNRLQESFSSQSSVGGIASDSWSFHTPSQSPIGSNQNGVPFKTQGFDGSLSLTPKRDGCFFGKNCNIA